MNWYYYSQSGKNGPYSETEMLHLLEDRTIDRNTFVVNDQLKDWIPLHDSTLARHAADRAKTNQAAQNSGGWVDNTTERINAMIGEKGPVDLNLRNLFSAVFQHHTRDEAEQIFMRGTSLTTPKEHELSAKWPKPWLFSRLFLLFCTIYLMLYLCYALFDTESAVSGLILIGSFAVPIVLVVFFFETNVPGNISILRVGEMFLYGGVASIIVTLILYDFVPVNVSPYGIDPFTALMIGIIEETGKLIIVIWFIKRMNTKFILNGLLIGAVIGAGFAAFESAGYVLSTLDRFTLYQLARSDDFLYVILLRAWESIGTHAIWTGIAGAAIVKIKQARPFQSKLLFHAPFIKLFAVPVILHALWDMSLPVMDNVLIKPAALIVVGWLFVFVLIHSGLRQIMAIQSSPHQGDSSKAAM
ncbi:PrsW family glutamic-type intramembrane protease [Sporolactobacillus vineae]|uniref:PrsW family glutamic-type intramembrane protease n=1 Tax=Sporolactobacillus vineae TaxID=444463 RepID=UPI000288B7F3|nr:PrsW family glutamic-type intramembrane protease [Sporolactobacillus vineae]